MLRGNHPMVNHSENHSSVEYLTHLGIKVVENLTLHNVYFGHQMTELSDMYFGMKVPNHERYAISIKALKDFKYSLLGHQHAFQKLTDKDYHLGSVIYTTFGELGVQKKYIAEYDEKNEQLYVSELKTPIPMTEVFNVQELDNIKDRTKVRMTFKTFEDLKVGINQIQKYKKKFHEFKIKCDFDYNKPQVESIKDKINQEDIVNRWLQSIKDKDVKKELKYEIACLRFSEKRSL